MGPWSIFPDSRANIDHGPFFYFGVYNSLDWHDEWFEKLDRARKSGATVPAWVNPEGVPDAVLDKDVRYEGLWVQALVLLTFGTVGILPIVIVLFIVVRKLLKH